MIRGNRLIGIRVRYPLEYCSSTDKLKSLILTALNGQSVPLESIAQIEMDEVTYEIRRENLPNIAAVTARLEDRDLGSAMDEIRRRLPAEVKLPPGADIEYGGLFQIQQKSFIGLTQVLLASILLIFIILVFEFQSFSHRDSCGDDTVQLRRPARALCHEHHAEHFRVHGRRYGRRHRPQERHPDARFRERLLRPRLSIAGRDLPCRAQETAPNSHDCSGNHLRHAAVGDRSRFRRADTSTARHRRHRRSRRLDGVIASCDARAVLQTPDAWFLKNAATAWRRRRQMHWRPACPVQAGWKIPRR